MLLPFSHQANGAVTDALQLPLCAVARAIVQKQHRTLAPHKELLQ